jgi:hypothetical protein
MPGLLPFKATAYRVNASLARIIATSKLSASAVQAGTSGNKTRHLPVSNGTQMEM